MFDYRKLRSNRLKSYNSINSNKLLYDLHQNIIERITAIDQKFTNILIFDLNYHSFPNMIFSKFSNSNLYVKNFSEDIAYTDDSIDLIIFPFGLHWINDIQKLLLSINNKLTKKGIFIAKLIAGKSLNNLYKVLVNLESLHSNKYIKRIGPFIALNSISDLMQQANFSDIIIDVDKVELESRTPLELIKAIKSLGESNTIISTNNTYSINKIMYNALSKSTEQNFTDQINIVTILASKNKNVIKLKYF
ncbi:methyltransferase domain-containing protein [Rickettsia endosymbiont of Cardiosporidium cionae]|uniref:methyltransferase domain-containing protein n=1 Tax=Rickettsia endosymbiont of Cardiosporidium cionae TaxID=2777155 RepID=UPI00189472BA|nr:methyltransferase domain-containing protein [Rickettsia endosymbiont of Cardiosporidium cionae]KAF8818324.1 methyltransferase domain-containing protein [Rickettsia endosymbiont of Cardiosporidium cionae]